MDAGLEIIPVLNKIDLPGAEPERRTPGSRRPHRLPIPRTCSSCSAKEGIGVPELLETIVQRVPPPKGDPDAPAPRAHLRFVLRQVSRCHPERARRGRRARKGTKITFGAAPDNVYEVAEVGSCSCDRSPPRSCSAGRSRLRGCRRAHGEGDARRRHDLRRRATGRRSRCPATRT